jgi:pathogenesis-related protein 1
VNGVHVTLQRLARFSFLAVLWPTALASVVMAGLLGPASADDAQTILNAHNAYRAKHCSPALTWSAQLAAGAQQWANACTKNAQGGFAHSPQAFQGNYGENLAWGGGLSAKGAVDMWYSEIGQYNFAAPSWNNKVGHFTQLVWKNSTQLGCAVANCSGQRFWVCRYAPPGNWNVNQPGVLAANVPQLCAAPPPPPPPPPPAQPGGGGDTGGNQRGPWSAFATDGKGNWGYGSHWATIEVASNLAVKGCGGANIGCKVFWSTKDKCVAYAESRKNGWWYAAGGGTSDQQARQNALRWCQSGNAPANSCKVAVAECR